MANLQHSVLTAAVKWQPLPAAKKRLALPVICFHCLRVNGVHHNFCTGCGYPVQCYQEHLQLFNNRRKERMRMLRGCYSKVLSARNVLYVSATFCAFSALFYATEASPGMIRCMVLLVMSLLFVGLGTWSLFKPFTSLLISFLIMITLIAINTWAEAARLFSSTSGWYTIVAQLALLYYITRGVKAAYKADVLQD
ncbi:hypothetical protein [Aridibaculum aurantiacum]|uniref:hypothetical protein n=1 Tax=Aridibaculum aurantiacum TaxID=2810307 RepID=UPI001A96AD29|nr:hypothetical protein [Aridibaculum aurantiacum]